MSVAVVARLCNKLFAMAGKLHPQSVLSAAGMQMPIIGLGTWQSSDDEVETSLNAALEAGYRHIDTAYRYGNEESIGKTLRKWFDSGKIKREQLFITTKLPPIAMNAQDVEEFLLKSLTALQLSYVDLYLIHHPMGFKDKDYKTLDMDTDLVAVWKAMEAQVDAGRAKAIGVSNFNPRQVDRLLKIARIPPANLQVELYLYLQQKPLQEWSKKSGVTLTAYAPLGTTYTKTIVSQKDGETKSLNPLEDPVVQRIAQRHAKSPAQILLRHIMQLGIAVIPKSVNSTRIRQNFQVFDFELSDEEMGELNALDRGEEGRRFLGIHCAGIEDHPEYPYK